MTNPTAEPKSPKDLALLERFREKCKDMELKAVDFLNSAGRIAHDFNRHTTVRCTFHDGTVITLPRRLEKHFDKQVFKLRPARDDA
jgi:hypothetical protein